MQWLKLMRYEGKQAQKAVFSRLCADALCCTWMRFDATENDAVGKMARQA